jgi:hypothetical protein
VRRPEVVIRIVEEDIPARYGTVPLVILQGAALSLAYTASKMPDLALRIKSYLDVLWERMLRMGAARSPSAVYTWLRSLLMTRQHSGFLATATALHARLRQAGHPHADAAVVPHLVHFHLQTGKCDQALSLLEGMTRIERGHPGRDYSRVAPRAARDLIKYACFAKFPYSQRRKLVKAALRCSDPSLLGATAKGMLLRFLLDGDNSVESACAALVTKDWHSPSYYYKLMRRLTQPRGARSDTPLPYLEASVHILEEYVPTNRHFSGAAVASIWHLVVKAVCTSDATEGERADLVRRTLACFPATLYSATHDLILLRTVVIDSLWRDDPFPALAEYYWSRLDAQSRGMTHEGELEVAISGFVAAGMVAAALQVVKSACRTKTTHGKIRTVLAHREEWTSPAFEEALYAAGVITEVGGPTVQRLPRFGIVYVGDDVWSAHTDSLEAADAAAEAMDVEDGDELELDD